MNGKFVTDGGSNMIKGCVDLNARRLGCIAHGLHNLVVVDCIEKLPEVRDLIGKCKKTFNKFKYHKALLKDEYDRITFEDLMEYVELFEEEENCPYEHLNNYNVSNEVEQEADQGRPAGAKRFTQIKNSNVTRWSSVNEMVQSILKHIILINKVLDKHFDLDDCFTPREIGLLRELGANLQSIAKATKELQTEDRPIANEVLLCFYNIKLEFDEKKDTNFNFEPARKFRRLIRENLNHRFPIEDEFIVAAILDPMVKEHPIVIDVLQKRPGSKYTDVPSYLSDRLKEFQQKATPKPEATVSQADSQPMGRKRASLRLLATELGDQNYLNKSRSNEVIRYLESTDAEDEEFDVELLEFWKRNSSVYPELFQLFKSVACLQPTSSPAERRFSRANLVSTTLRNRLLASNLQMVLFIRENFLVCEASLAWLKNKEIEAAIPAEDPESTDSEDEVRYELNENDAEMNSLTQPMSLV